MTQTLELTTKDLNVLKHSLREMIRGNKEKMNAANKKGYVAEAKRQHGDMTYNRNVYHKVIDALNKCYESEEK